MQNVPSTLIGFPQKLGRAKYLQWWITSTWWSKVDYLTLPWRQDKYQSKPIQFRSVCLLWPSDHDDEVQDEGNDEDIEVDQDDEEDQDDEDDEDDGEEDQDDEDDGQ